MKRRLLNFATNACLTIGLVIVCIWGYQKQAQMQDRLVQSQKEIEVLKQVKKQSDVAQSISEQMSDIADAEREGALAQAEIAEQRAEEARAAQSEEKRQRDIAVRKSEEA